MSETASVSNHMNDAALAGMRHMEMLLRDLAERRGVIGSEWKKLKSDGHNIKAMKVAMKRAKLDPTEVVAEMRAENQLTSMRMRIPLDDLFGDLDVNAGRQVSAEHDVWTAEDNGYRAGRSGVKADECPYNAGTEQAQAWRREWSKGQASLAHEMGPGARVASASRARPARQTSLPGTEDSAPPRKRNGAAKKKRGRKKAGARRPGRVGQGSSATVN